MSKYSPLSALRRHLPELALLALFLLPALSWAATVPAPGLPGVTVTQGAGGQTQYSLSLQLLALMTSLTLLPSALLMMTAFVRIIIVLSMLRLALGMQSTPPNTVLVSLALFLTLFTIHYSKQRTQELLIMRLATTAVPLKDLIFRIDV